jgi:ABC-type glycerol-3-phosphate transport system substrate-binding protein
MWLRESKYLGDKIMLKKFSTLSACGLITLLLIGLFLTGCGEQPTTSPAESTEKTTPSETEKTKEEAKEETADEEAGAETEANQKTEVEATSEVTETEKLGASCMSVDIPENKAIALVTDSDWAKGPANAPVTMIEYGDFQ